MFDEFLALENSMNLVSWTVFRLVAIASRRLANEAEPDHYAAGVNRWIRWLRLQMIEYLPSIGADSNALNKSAVAPLPRAVPTRSVAAVHHSSATDSVQTERTTSGGSGQASATPSLRRYSYVSS